MIPLLPPSPLLSFPLPLSPFTLLSPSFRELTKYGRWVIEHTGCCFFSNVFCHSHSWMIRDGINEEPGRGHVTSQEQVVYSMAT